MKKTFVLILSLIMLITTVALAEGADRDALDAFYALTGRTEEAQLEATATEYLGDVMAGFYTELPTDMGALSLLANDLFTLTGITSKDIAAYASANAMSVKQVRNAYYLALGNVLRAEFSVNPDQEGKNQNVQTILKLFLNHENPADDTARSQIRQEMNSETASVIAQEYDLPTEFVSFLIMDENWEDELWDNDDDWKATANWNAISAVDAAADLKLGDRDSRTSHRVAELQEQLIALGYLTGKADGIFGERTYRALREFQSANGLETTGTFSTGEEALMKGSSVVARWDYDDSFDHTPDNTPYIQSTSGNVTNSNSYDTPDRTPDYTPDRTPDNTPDNTRDNTPDNTR